MKRKSEYLESIDEKLKKLKMDMQALKQERFYSADGCKERVAAFEDFISKKGNLDELMRYTRIHDLWCTTTRKSVDWTHGETTKIKCELVLVLDNDQAKIENDGTLNTAKTQTCSMKYKFCTQSDHHGTKAFEDLDIACKMEFIADDNLSYNGYEESDVKDLICYTCDGKPKPSVAQSLESAEEHPVFHCDKTSRLFALFWEFLYNFSSTNPPTENEKLCELPTYANLF